MIRHSGGKKCRDSSAVQQLSNCPKETNYTEHRASDACVQVLKSLIALKDMLRVGSPQPTSPIVKTLDMRPPQVRFCSVGHSAFSNDIALQLLRSPGRLSDCKPLRRTHPSIKATPQTFTRSANFGGPTSAGHIAYAPFLRSL